MTFTHQPPPMTSHGRQSISKEFTATENWKETKPFCIFHLYDMVMLMTRRVERFWTPCSFPGSHWHSHSFCGNPELYNEQILRGIR
jgi:hypothetical protein